MVCDGDFFAILMLLNPFPLLYLAIDSPGFARFHNFVVNSVNGVAVWFLRSAQ